MYIENKEQLNGTGRIGRVTFSKTGKTVHYQGKEFQSLKGDDYKANYYDIETGEPYWISGPRKRAGDRLYGQPGVHIDEDVREEYWTSIRGMPERALDAST
ncbi:MAG: 1-deoxy-D-xylulose-5-phosphate synthase [Armatimonadetes bacterium]|nr:1-deoxy-D-xylulose-5-phosphate synthase [Armatimonadota bacterium]